MAKKYDERGVRLTDCCGSWSQYDENGQLHCKKCFHDVLPGEGDGNETREGPRPSVRFVVNIPIN